MNKWLMLVALVLLTLASAVGLRNLEANQTVTPVVASTGNPVPVMPPPSGLRLVASTGNPVPVMPPPSGLSTGNPVPVMPPPPRPSGL